MSKLLSYFFLVADLRILPFQFFWNDFAVFAELGMNYGPIASRILKNGEPGLAWLHNMQNYGRMNGILVRARIFEWLTVSWSLQTKKW